MTATATTAAPENTTLARGFADLRCLLCGQQGDITLALADVSTFHCNQCEEDFTTADVEEAAAAWRAVIAWTRQAPAL